MAHQNRVIHPSGQEIITDNSFCDETPTFNDYLDSVRVLQAAVESIRLPALKKQLEHILKSNELSPFTEYEVYEGSDPVVLAMHEKLQAEAVVGVEL